LSSLRSKASKKDTAEGSVLIPENRTSRRVGKGTSTAAPCVTPSSWIAKQPGNHKDVSDKEKEKVSHDKTPEDSVTDASDDASFETVKSRKQWRKNVIKTDTFTLPPGVEVICDHFERETFTHPQHSNKIPKVCQGCESRSKYAYWSRLSKKWIRVKNVPPYIPESVTIRRCYRYQNGKECSKGCTHAHGPELEMWNLQRGGGNKWYIISKQNHS
jgi:hypothetical protein